MNMDPEGQKLPILVYPIWITGMEVPFFVSFTGLSTSVADPDLFVFWPPGSGTGCISKRYGSGSFYNQAIKH
jgi:hypothetical protein